MRKQSNDTLRAQYEAQGKRVNRKAQGVTVLSALALYVAAHADAIQRLVPSKWAGAAVIVIAVAHAFAQEPRK